MKLNENKISIYKITLVNDAFEKKHKTLLNF